MRIIREEDRTRLCLEGELTVYNAAAVRDDLLQVLGQSEEVELDLGEVTTVDLAGLQLLCAAHRLAHHRGKTLSLAPGSQTALFEARRAAGFMHNKSCRHALETDCFWVGGMDQ